MKAFVGQDIYDFLFTRKEAETLGSSPLEADLIDANTQKSTGKRITLRFGEPEFGDAELDVKPLGACWDCATALSIVMKRKYLDSVKQEGQSNARLSYGDVFLQIE